MGECFSVSYGYRFAEPRPVDLWSDFALVLETLKQSIKRACVRFPFTSGTRLAMVQHRLWDASWVHRMILVAPDNNGSVIRQTGREPNRRVLPECNAFQEQFYSCSVTPD